MTKTGKSRGSAGNAVNPHLIDGAKDYVLSAQQVKRVKCRVCGAPGATERSDRLCWICQHLKISAWRNSEIQEAVVE